MKASTNRLSAIGGQAPTNGAAFGTGLQEPYRAAVTIQGTADLLFHAWNCEAVESKARAAKGSREKRTDDLESFVYRNDTGHICIPGTYLRAAILNAAKFKQDPRSPRKSAVDLFKAGIVNLTPMAPLGIKTWDYEHKCRVTIQRSAVTRTFPAIKSGWKAGFILMCLVPEYISPELLSETVHAAGRLIGIGDFRPTYGRFTVNSFAKLDD